jgi:hypothetical protein
MNPQGVNGTGLVYTRAGDSMYPRRKERTGEEVECPAAEGLGKICFHLVHDRVFGKLDTRHDD